MKAITLLLIAVIIYSCNSNPLVPELVKDPKQYIWSIDTIHFNDQTMLQSILGSIWGSSEKDVYIVGHGDAGNPIVHYDGQNWKDLDKVSIGLRYSFDPLWIHGFGNNDVWVAGSSSRIINELNYRYATVYNFNGGNWVLNEIPIEIELSYLWGKNPNDIWACGSNGVVAHYNGSEWKVDTIKIVEGTTGNFWIRSIIEYNNIMYATGFKNPRNYLFQKVNNVWAQNDSFVDGELSKWGDSRFFITSDNKLWSYGYGGVWEMQNNSWVKIITTELSTSGISEYAKGKFIITDFNGKVYLYSNGVLELLKDFGQNPHLYNIWANNKECFILANKLGSGINSKTLIYHGK